MLIDNAVALAGVYVHEGFPRDLSRKRRALRAWRQARDDDSGVMDQTVEGSDDYDVVGSDARSFWSREYAPSTSFVTTRLFMSCAREVPRLGPGGDRCRFRVCLWPHAPVPATT